MNIIRCETIKNNNNNKKFVHRLRPPDLDPPHHN